VDAREVATDLNHSLRDAYVGPVGTYRETTVPKQLADNRFGFMIDVVDYGTPKRFLVVVSEEPRSER
jgi:hypothetical protein